MGENNYNREYQIEYYKRIKANGKYEENKRKMREAYDAERKAKKREYYLLNKERIKNNNHDYYLQMRDALKEVRQQRAAEQVVRPKRGRPRKNPDN
jgi:hypothetical protein